MKEEVFFFQYMMIIIKELDEVHVLFRRMQMMKEVSLFFFLKLLNLVSFEINYSYQICFDIYPHVIAFISFFLALSVEID